jgi:hypothetical protein
MIRLKILYLLLCLLLVPTNVFANWLDKSNWKLVSVTSEETVKYDEKAIYAFDGKPNTHWFSRHTSNQVPLPQEIQIDLGKEYEISAFSYLPMQSTNKNGTVLNYEFYVSKSTTAWGTPAKGTFSDTTTIKERVVNFSAPMTGRYIRFRSLKEINNHASYMSVAELGVKTTTADIKEFPYGKIRATLEPSPDSRVTGHNFYVLNQSTNKETKYDLKKEVMKDFEVGTLEKGTIYRLTASAYGMVDKKLQESVRSAPYLVRLVDPVEPEDPLLPPTTISIEMPSQVTFEEVK